MLKKYLFICFSTILLSAFNASAKPAQRTEMLSLRASFAEAVQRVSPAVVNIYANTVIRQSASPFGNHPFFQDFFGNFPGNFPEGFPGAPVQERLQKSLGSGVILTEDGFLVTNLHVIQGAESVQVVFPDKRERTAYPVVSDSSLDIALLKLELTEGETVPHATLADSDSLQVGDVALAIGNPFGVGQSVSIGIVSGLGRSNLGTGTFENFIQTDAAINPGNSGGALVDSTGAVIGINTAIFTRSGGSQGLGFATPANVVANVLNSVLNTGKITRAWLGATVQSLTPVLSRKLGLASPQGALVNDVFEGGPAGRAGLKIGDIITHINGNAIVDAPNLRATMASIPAEGKAQLSVWREGTAKTLVLPLETPPERSANDVRILEGDHPLDGYTIEALSPALNQQMGLPLEKTGVAVTRRAQKNSRFFGVTLKAGDILEEINDVNIKTLNDVERALARRTRNWEIVYTRGGAIYRVRVR